MTIQLITNDSSISKFAVNKVSTLNKPKAFDMYDINIIDLSYPLLWTSRDLGSYTVDSIKDFISIKEMAKSSKKSKIVYVLPQNISFKNSYHYSQGKEKYRNSYQLKDSLDVILDHNLVNILPFAIQFCLFYENSESKILEETYKSAFVFKSMPAVGYEPLVYSVGTKKPSTIASENSVLTTLDILGDDFVLLNFLRGTGILQVKSEAIPEWLLSYSILDDETQRQIVTDNERIINEAKARIKGANSILNKNMEYKSILYENGDSLVNHVFTILEELLECTLSDFEDMKKEDFLIRFDDVTFIGEIKGVTSNVKYEHVSQVDTNANIYLDRLEESGEKENIKQLLIINPKRNKPLSEREPINHDQINLAERNKSLIITTETLLKLFEKYRNKEVTTETIKDKFINEIGLLDLGVF